MYPAIGGAVEKQTPDKTLSWAFYLADYLRYLDPQEGPSDHLTDGNVSYKRAALEKIKHLWAEEFHENVVHAALAGNGGSLWLSPKIIVRQKRPSRSVMRCATATPLGGSSAARASKGSARRAAEIDAPLCSASCRVADAHRLARRQDPPLRCCVPAGNSGISSDLDGVGVGRVRRVRHGAPG